jgi:hypothetical protein
MSVARIALAVIVAAALARAADEPPELCQARKDHRGVDLISDTLAAQSVVYREERSSPRVLRLATRVERRPPERSPEGAEVYVARGRTLRAGNNVPHVSGYGKLRGAAQVGTVRTFR